MQQFRYLQTDTDALAIPCCLESRSLYLREALKETPIVVDTSRMTELVTSLFQVSQFRSSVQLSLVLHGASLMFQDSSSICEVIEKAIRGFLPNLESALELKSSLNQTCCSHLAQYSEQYRFLCCLV